IARGVDATNGGHVFLKLRVKTVETIQLTEDKDFLPPTDAINLLDKPITGVSLEIIHAESPQWPASMRERHFTVTMKILVGKNGHVKNTEAISGPADAYKAAEAAARHWVYHPYILAGEPVEVQTTGVASVN